MNDNDSGMGYGRFLAMIATSTIVMYGLMYLNTYAWDQSGSARHGSGWRC